MTRNPQCSLHNKLPGPRATIGLLPIDIPANYHLTFSLADGNDAASIAAIDNGMNVAAVFRTKDTVARYMAIGHELGGPSMCP